jgi:hypothetical protein
VLHILLGLVGVCLQQTLFQINLTESTKSSCNIKKWVYNYTLSAVKIGEINVVEDDSDFNLDYYILVDEQELGSVAYELAQIMDYNTGWYE